MDILVKELDVLFRHVLSRPYVGGTHLNLELTWIYGILVLQLIADVTDKTFLLSTVKKKGQMARHHVKIACTQALIAWQCG